MRHADCLKLVLSLTLGNAKVAFYQRFIIYLYIQNPHTNNSYESNCLLVISFRLGLSTGRDGYLSFVIL